jgi:ribosomal protein S18 acetylase RimI-like enzyme
MIDSNDSATHHERTLLEASMTLTPAGLQDYPKQVDVAGEPVTLRLLEPSDAAKLHDFVMQLSPPDLLFLPRDVSDSKEIDAWLAEVAEGHTVTLIAEADGTMFGETTLRSSRVPWTGHVGTIRVITSPAQRSRGLGRLLLEEAFALAAQRGIEKIVAEMTVEQAAAQRLFEQLGFREEGRYRNYVKDRQGAAHDLIVMTRDQPAPRAASAAGAPAVRGWRCSACGHVTPASEQPARCPDCGAAGEVLTVVDETPPARG